MLPPKLLAIYVLEKRHSIEEVFSPTFAEVSALSQMIFEQAYREFVGSGFRDDVTTAAGYWFLLRPNSGVRTARGNT